jgi:hypothetical protein
MHRPAPRAPQVLAYSPSPLQAALRASNPRCRLVQLWAPDRPGQAHLDMARNDWPPEFGVAGLVGAMGAHAGLMAPPDLGLHHLMGAGERRGRWGAAGGPGAGLGRLPGAASGSRAAAAAG